MVTPNVEAADRRSCTKPSRTAQPRTDCLSDSSSPVLSSDVTCRRQHKADQSSTYNVHCACCTPRYAQPPWTRIPVRGTKREKKKSKCQTADADARTRLAEPNVEHGGPFQSFGSAVSLHRYTTDSMCRCPIALRGSVEVAHNTLLGLAPILDHDGDISLQPGRLRSHIPLVRSTRTKR